MEIQIKILSDDFPAADLKKYLEQSFEEPSLTFKIKESEVGTKSDPVVIATLITASASILTNIALNIVSIYQTKRNSKDVLITIKRKDGTQVSFPKGSSRKEIEEYFRLAETSDIGIDFIGFLEQ